MGKIIGEFEVTLPVPITINPKILNTPQAPCEFQIEDNDVLIWLGKCTDPVYYAEFDEWEVPRLIELRIFISRPASSTSVGEISNQLTREEEKNFERILIEATRRFVSAISCVVPGEHAKDRLACWNGFPESAPATGAVDRCGDRRTGAAALQGVFHPHHAERTTARIERIRDSRRTPRDVRACPRRSSSSQTVWPSEQTACGGW